MSKESNLRDWLAHAVESLQVGNIDGWTAIYAPDAIHEFPLAPEGAPHR